MIEIIDNYYLTISLLVTIAYQLLFFAVAWTNKFDKVTDFAGGSNAIVISILTLCLSQTYNPRQIAITVCASVWGLRLAVFLLYRILKTSEDTRFNEIRNNFFKYLSFLIFQIIWIFTICIPVTLTNSPYFSLINTEFGTPSDIIGIVFFILGLFIETVSDIQKFKFNQRRTDKFDIIQVGLWKYSRHPNYFGEILLWWGVFILSISSTVTSYSYLGLIGLLSPFLTSFLLLLFSGIPQSEPKKEQQFQQAGKFEIWKNYTKSTSTLIPLPNSLYSILPQFIKTWILLDLPVYRNKNNDARSDSEEGLL